jgi:Glycosyl transferase family 2
LAIPLFSIVVVHYQGVNSHEVFCRGMASLKAQTFQDYEILAYHDGPLLDDSMRMPVPVICTDRRYNDWGHSLRDRGIREASGQYILHFSADNILYPNALEEIAKEIYRAPRLFDQQTKQPLDTNDIIIFPVIMVGLHKFRDITLQFKNDSSFFLILTGTPPVVQNIDCMQLVMKRELWLREGGWHDKRQWGDGYMYQEFTQKYGYRTVGPVLGEHR